MKLLAKIKTRAASKKLDALIPIGGFWWGDEAMTLRLTPLRSFERKRARVRVGSGGVFGSHGGHNFREYLEHAGLKRMSSAARTR